MNEQETIIRITFEREPGCSIVKCILCVIDDNEILYTRIISTIDGYIVRNQPEFFERWKSLCTEIGTAQAHKIKELIEVSERSSGGDPLSQLFNSPQG